MSVTTGAIRFGTRGSALALRQTERVIDLAVDRWPGLATEEVVISTAGDVDKVTPLTVIGGHGVFTSALEAALLSGQIDAAVHSAKDLPSETPSGLALVAFPERASPEDVFVSRHGLPLAGLPSRPIVGTSSRRRALQIALARPDARIVQMRGNLDTRLRKALADDLDGIVLAAAGIERMGWQDRITERLPLDRFIPAPGQGALAVEIRANDDRARALLTPLDDSRVSLPVRIERALLRALGAGCLTPVGAHVDRVDGALRLRAMLANDAGRVVWADETLDAADPEAHAADIARSLQARLDAGTTRFPVPATVDSESSVHGVPLAGLRVLVTRPAEQAASLIASLTAAGAEPLSWPVIRIDDPDDWAPLDRALRAAADGAYDWIIVTSANAADRIARRAAFVGAALPERMRVAVVGPATAAALAAAGMRVDVLPTQSQAEGIVAALRPLGMDGARVLYPHGDLARDTIRNELTALGAIVDTVVAYRTVPNGDGNPAARARLLAGEIDALTFASPSSARRLAEELGPAFLAAAHMPAVCVGPVTAETARALGYEVAAVAAESSAEGIAAALAAWRREQRDAIAAGATQRNPNVASDGKGA